MLSAEISKAHGHAFSKLHRIVKAHKTAIQFQKPTGMHRIVFSKAHGHAFSKFHGTAQFLPFFRVFRHCLVHSSILPKCL